jgi:phasin family protein
VADRKTRTGATKAVTAKRAAPARKKSAETAKPVAKARPARLTSGAVSRPAIKATQTAANTTNAINEGTKTMTNETIKKVQAEQAAAADRFQAVFGDANERAKVAFEKSGKLLEEVTDLTRGNVEALVASSKVAARGFETLSQEAAEYGRRSFEEASAAFKSFAEVKSATDFFRLQSDYARSAFDSLVAETSKVSEQVIKLAGEVAEPITSRYSVAAERVKSIAA